MSTIVNNQICFSVIMPTYNQCCYIRRAILSLFQQTYSNWELVIINDGSTDETEWFISEYLEDNHVIYIKNAKNQGLGYSINKGLNAANNDYIAYLPSDDYYYPHHLESFYKYFIDNPESNLVFSGIRYDANDSLHSAKDTESIGIRKGYCLQLVQTVHKKTNMRWTERKEWISADLFSMFWRKLTCYGYFGRTNTITAYWTQHPFQRHKLVEERYGGNLNKARRFYDISEPMKLRVSKDKFIDEESIYKKYHKRYSKKKNPLKILLVGELSYNPQRITALEEAGHELYGLWLPFPTMTLSNVGPLPFGNVHEINIDRWKTEVKELNPSIIYAMMNWESIPFVYEVVKAFPTIPLAWHYKEGPHIAISSGLWSKLVYLYNHATIKIYINQIVKQWYEQFIPSKGMSLIIDGDLPKKEYFKNTFSEKLSRLDNEIHTVCTGRLIGLHYSEIKYLLENHIHLHIYLENTSGKIDPIIEYFRYRRPDYFHIHPHCSAEEWTSELSKYDAGWLHFHKSSNNGSIMEATWDDLNVPARISTYLAAGLPVIQMRNNGAIVAIEETVKKYNIGVLFNSLKELPEILSDKEKMKLLNENAIACRHHFCFDYYVPELLKQFENVTSPRKHE